MVGIVLHTYKYNTRRVFRVQTLESDGRYLVGVIQVLKRVVEPDLQPLSVWHGRLVARLEVLVIFADVSYRGVHGNLLNVQTWKTC